jgi:hypothetical protein
VVTSCFLQEGQGYYLLFIAYCLLLKANRVGGMGITRDLVVQRKDLSDDSHTSAPDWLRVSLSLSFLVLLLVSAQIQPGNMPNLT